MHFKNKQRLHYLFFYVAGALLFCFFHLDYSFAENLVPQPKAAAVISKKIRPYYEALEGFASEFKKASNGETEIFEIDDFDKSTSALSVRIGNGNFDIALAIGPEASKFILHEKIGKIQKLYLMLLNSEELTAAGTSQPCGISLTIPVSDQINKIYDSIPSLKRLGIIFDPALNETFVKKAETESERLGISIIRIQARSHQEIIPSLEKGLEKIDALWMIPDQTVISESLVPFIIKKSISSGIPTIGYNRYFLQNGAAVSFVINYSGIGVKAAKLATKMIYEKNCSWESPDYEILRNEKVIEMLKVGPGAVNQQPNITHTGANGANGHK